MVGLNWTGIWCLLKKAVRSQYFIVTVFWCRHQYVHIFSPNCREHQVFPSVELTYYYAYSYRNGPQCRQTMHFKWHIFTGKNRKTTLICGLCCVLIIKVSSIGLFNCKKCSVPTDAKCLILKSLSADPSDVLILSLISMHQTLWFSETTTDGKTFMSATFLMSSKRDCQKMYLCIFTTQLYDCFHPIVKCYI